MGFRFRKSIKFGGIRINLSKKGIGYSVGGKGFRYTKKAGGGTRTTTSIPGTGMSWVNDSKKSTKQIRRKVSGSGKSNLYSGNNPANLNTIPYPDEILKQEKRAILLTLISLVLLFTLPFIGLPLILGTLIWLIVIGVKLIKFRHQYKKGHAKHVNSFNNYVHPARSIKDDTIQKNIEEVRKSQNIEELEQRIAYLKSEQKKIEKTMNPDTVQQLRSEAGYEIDDQNVIEVVGTSKYDGASILSRVVHDLGGTWNVNGYQEHTLKLTLKAEHDNQFDMDAIVVISEYESPAGSTKSRGGIIGYIPKKANVKFDEGVIGSTVTATVKEGFDKFWIKVDLTKLKNNGLLIDR